MHQVDCNYLETWYRKYVKLDISSSSFHFKWKKPISSRLPSQFLDSNELVNSNATAKYCIQHIFAVVSLVLRITTSCKENITGSPISILFKNLIPVSSTSRGRNLFLPGSYCSFWFHFPWKEHVNSNTIVKYLYSTQFAVVSLVLRITASCKGKYLLNHAFQLFSSFFHFRWKKPISSGTV